MIENTKLRFEKPAKRDVYSNRCKVAAALIESSKSIKNTRISAISTEDLYMLYNLYDDIFFDKKLKGSGIIVSFSLSRRMTSSAGKTFFKKPTSDGSQSPQNDCIYEIRIGVDFFFNYNLTSGKKLVCGIETDNSLDALLLVFEHELCHVLEQAFYGDSNCSKQRFKTLASNLFDHKASHHQLPTHRQIAYECHDLKVGDLVSFSFDGKCHKGIINRINKRATVMVESRDGDYRDKKGKRYNKYYVPLKLLEK